jgi:catechol 2,3-dioxygenase-like lactoylglutathione lyase family enzyme
MSATASVGTIMVDCNDLDTMVGFWSELLGLEEAGRYPSYAWLGPLGAGGPSLAFQKVPEERVGKNRIHLDVSTADPAAFQQRVIGLGGGHVEDHELQGFHWSVLSDPEGNVFCVTAAV